MALHFLLALEQMQGFLTWKRRHHPDWPDLRLEWGLYHQLRGGLALAEASAPDLREEAENLLAEAYQVLLENQDADRSFGDFAEWDAWTLRHMPVQGAPAPAPSAEEIERHFRAGLGEGFSDIADHLLPRLGDLAEQPEILLRAVLGRPFRRLFGAMAEYFAFQGQAEKARELAAWSVLVGGEPVRHWILGAQIERVCGRGEDVVALLDEGLARFPGRVELMRERAQEYERQGQLALALDMMKAAVALKPEWPDLRFDMARLHQDAEQNEESLAQFGKALELNPRYERAARSRVEILELLGDHETAEKILDNLRGRKIAYAEIYQMLSEIYAERDDRNRAEHFGHLAHDHIGGENPS